MAAAQLFQHGTLVTIPAGGGVAVAIGHLRQQICQTVRCRPFRRGACNGGADPAAFGGKGQGGAAGLYAHRLQLRIGGGGKVVGSVAAHIAVVDLVVPTHKGVAVIGQCNQSYVGTL